MRLPLPGLLALLAAVPAAGKEPDVEAPGRFWKRLRTPRPGEWRWSFREPGQTFAEYKAANPVRATARRRRIYLQPYLTRPPRAAGLLGRLAVLLGAFYAREVTTLPPRALPPGAYDRERRRVTAFRLAPHLVRALPDDALFLLAVTDRDLAVGELPQAYGWGSFTLRVGVMSTFRLGERGAGAALQNRRAVTLAAHETAHMLSLPHCTFYACLMNGARTMAEADRRPALLCPVCRAKVCWNLGLDPLDRYARLAPAFTRAGLAREARRAREAAAVTRLHAKS